METHIDDNMPTYMYKLVNGKSSLKGGISVLKNLDYPEYLLKETQEILKKLE